MASKKAKKRKSTIGGKRGPVRSLVTINRQLEVSRLWARGWRNQQEIAEKLGVTPPTVNRDLRIIFTEARVRLGQRAVQLQAQLLLELEQVKREAWTAWEGSKEPKETLTDSDYQPPEEEDDDERPRRESESRVTVKYEQRDPNPQYLKTVLTAVEDEMALLGIKKSDLEGEAPPALRLNFRGMSKTQLDVIEKYLANDDFRGLERFLQLSVEQGRQADTQEALAEIEEAEVVDEEGGA